jgi:hypothetical protein
MPAPAEELASLPVPARAGGVRERRPGASATGMRGMGGVGTAAGDAIHGAPPNLIVVFQGFGAVAFVGDNGVATGRAVC